ncbi:MAG: hypothetical protein ACLQOO_12765 [Terriglobia bacterium]
MRRAALGFRAHSGWAVMVAVAEPMAAPTAPTPMVIERRRIELVGTGTAAPVQPYHAARELDLERARQFIEGYTTEAKRRAESAVGAAIERLRVKDWEVVACGILLASARPLPSLAEILVSHPLIHTAEGELFRNALKTAGESCGLPVIGVKERDLYARAAAQLGTPAERLRSGIDSLGRTLGPPWRQDEKYAALVGWLALSKHCRLQIADWRTRNESTDYADFTDS